MVLYTRLEISLYVCIYIYSFTSRWHQAVSWHLVQANCAFSWYKPGICVCRVNNVSGVFSLLLQNVEYTTCDTT